MSILPRAKPGWKNPSPDTGRSSRLHERGSCGMNIYTELAVAGYQRVVRCDNEQVGFTAWIAVHDTTLGPALGGCRVWNYGSDEEAFTDVLRLSRGMTYKNALAGLDLGGGKSTVRTNLAKVDRTALFTNLGYFVEHLGGLYITAEDVNSTLADMEVVASQTSHVATVGASGNPSPFTAYGVYCAIKASVYHRMKRKNLDGLGVALQGVGETGGRLAQMLADDGCRIIAADVNGDNIALLQEKIDFERVAPEKIFDVDADIFSPCALGGILNEQTIPRLRCRVVAGSANNQLLCEENGEALRRRDILYAPDYAANAGGVINISCEIGQSYDAAVARKKVSAIADVLTKIFRLSDRQALPTSTVADSLAEQRIARKRTSRSSLTATA